MTSLFKRSIERAAESAPRGYAPVRGIRDEMVGPDGRVRPHWRAYSDWLRDCAPENLENRARRAGRLLRDNFSEPRAGRSEWRVNLAPLILSAEDWAQVTAIASQRARLYTALQNDLYGQQRLFREGALPPDFVLSDPRFLRPLFGSASEQNGLTMLALDLGRGRDGAWRVIDAHAETTAGHGYAIANRMVLADVAGDLFGVARVRRIGAFYQRLWESLARRAGGDDPRIALLAGGPTAPGFNGHAYLARYLGYHRVEGSDLRVIEDRVYLKSTNGLQRIDLILRGVEGRSSDPLELSPDGFEGPPGLTQAARARPWLIANSLGASIIENRAFSPFLGAISNLLLGEELVAPDSPRLWLGQGGIRAQVLAELDDYVVHKAFEGAGRPGDAALGRRAAQMSPEGRARFRTEIELFGHQLVAEKPLGFSTAPSWTPDGLKPAPVALRVFVTILSGRDKKDDADGAPRIDVLPGGVGLALPDQDTVGLTAHNAMSHDVWVVGAGSGLALTKTGVASQHPPHRVDREIQSRVADDLFWLGRYAERADSMLRIIRQAMTQVSADGGGDGATPIRALAHLMPEAETTTDDPTLSQMLRSLIGDQEPATGLADVLAQIRRLGAQNRDILSSDTWRTLSGLRQDALPQPLAPPSLVGAARRADAVPLNITELIEACDTLLTRISAFNGLTHENMTQDRGWLFLDLGRRVERAMRLADFLRNLFDEEKAPDVERSHLDIALAVSDSALGYRKRYRFAPALNLVMDLLLIEETNPRSIAHQLAAIHRHIGDLPKSADDAMRSPEQRLALELRTRVQLFDCAALASDTSETSAAAHIALSEMLKEITEELPKLSEMISRRYFSLADEAPRRVRAQGA